MAQGQRGGCEDGGRRSGIALTGQDVENDIGGVDAVGERLGTGGLDRRQPVGQHRGEVSVVRTIDTDRVYLEERIWRIC